ncbi:OmpA family protein [Burkholderia lata]|uniref:OmpA family protein n=1 Tax=Burkholderia lata (strain ATCC 17760 / DSM 23089 / LMG 22485 / NCIMB 9086 / R18194 / 383) TaxID=482957 RepID=UPI00399B04CA
MSANVESTGGAKRGRHADGDTIVKRAPRRAHDHDHGGNWKVAFADFCLALMCLFLLLWVLAARDEEETRIKLIEMSEQAMYDGGAGMFEGTESVPSLDEPIGPRSVYPSTGAVTWDADGALAQLAERFDRLGADAGLQDNLRSVMTPFGLRLMLHDSESQGVFERGSAAPAPPFRPLLDKMGALFAQTDSPLLVIGHTDSVPYRKYGLGGRSNWHLSADRAMSARRALVEGGMPPGRVLQVIGMADRAPLSNDSRAAHNRRIEFVVTTPEYARTLAAMFGPPTQVAPWAPGIDVASAGVRRDE